MRGLGDVQKARLGTVASHDIRILGRSFQHEDIWIFYWAQVQDSDSTSSIFYLSKFLDCGS